MPPRGYALSAGWRALRRLVRRRWYLLAGILVAVAAVAGWAGPSLRRLGSLSILELVAAGTIALSAVALYRQSRFTVILPFRNLTGDERLDAFANGFGELLEVEIHRINRLRSGRVGSGVESTNTPALSRGEVPGVTAVRELQTASGSGEGSLADVGAVDVAGFRLQLGNLARSILGRPTISGSVIKVGKEIRLVVDSAGHPRRKWSLPLDWDIDEDAAERAERLARALAYRLVWHSEGQRTGGDWQSFRHLIDGLDHYKSYVKQPRLGHLRHAEERFLDAIAIYPFAPACYNLGVIREERAFAYGRQERPDDYLRLMREASDSYRLAIEIDPDMALAHLRLAETLAARAGTDAQVQVDGIVSAARTAVVVADRQGAPFPSGPSARITLARALVTWDSDDPALNLARLREAVSLCKEAERGFRLLRLWNGVDSEDATPLAAELVEAIRFRGALEAERDRHRRASTALRKAVRRDPGDPFGHALLGRSLSRRGHWVRAWDELAEALRRDPLLEDAVMWMAEWLVSRDRLSDAILVYGYALSLTPERQDAFENPPDNDQAQRTREALDQVEEGRRRMREGELGAAVERFQSAITASVDAPISPEVVLTWTLELADALAAAGDALAESRSADAHDYYRRAIDIYTEVVEKAGALQPISVAPPEGRPFRRRRRPDLRLDPAGAVEARARALAGRGEARLSLAVDLARKDDDLVAVREDCREAIRLLPTYPFPQDTLARAYRQLGDEDSAIETWRRVAILAPQATADVAVSIAEILVNRARFVQNQRRRRLWLEQAAEEYRTALSEDLPGDRENVTRWALAETLFDLGRAEDAVAELERIEANAPASAVVLLARAYQAAGRLWEAEDRYRRALDMETKAFEAAADAGKPEAALSLADMKNWFAYFHAEQADDLEEGERLIGEALLLLKEFPPAEERTRHQAAFLDTRGWLRYQAEDYDSCIRDLRDSLRDDVTAETREHLALALTAKARTVKDHAERRHLLDAAERQWDYVEQLDPEAASKRKRALV